MFQHWSACLWSYISCHLFLATTSLSYCYHLGLGFEFVTSSMKNPVAYYVHSYKVCGTWWWFPNQIVRPGTRFGSDPDRHGSRIRSLIPANHNNSGDLAVFRRKRNRERRNEKKEDWKREQMKEDLQGKRKWRRKEKRAPRSTCVTAVWLWSVILIVRIPF